jgi:hypothetical protein
MRVLITLICAGLLSAQIPIVVVDLSPADAVMISDLYRQRAEIDKKIEVARVAIGLKYVTWASFANDADGKPLYKFEFSSDFRHIVSER